MHRKMRIATPVCALVRNDVVIWLLVSCNVPFAKFNFA